MPQFPSKMPKEEQMMTQLPVTMPAGLGEISTLSGLRAFGYTEEQIRGMNIPDMVKAYKPIGYTQPLVDSNIHASTVSSMAGQLGSLAGGRLGGAAASLGTKSILSALGMRTQEDKELEKAEEISARYKEAIFRRTNRKMALQAELLRAGNEIPEYTRKLKAELGRIEEDYFKEISDLRDKAFALAPKRFTTLKEDINEELGNLLFEKAEIETEKIKKTEEEERAELAELEEIPERIERGITTGAITPEAKAEALEIPLYELQLMTEEQRRRKKELRKKYGIKKELFEQDLFKAKRR